MTGSGGTGHEGGRLGGAPRLIDRACIDGRTRCDAPATTCRSLLAPPKAPTDHDREAFAVSLLARSAPYRPGDLIANEGRTSGFGLPGQRNTSSLSLRIVYALRPSTGGSIESWPCCKCSGVIAGEFALRLRGLSRIAVRLFHLFSGMPFCLIFFGKETEVRFRFSFRDADLGSSIVSLDESAPHPARVCNGFKVLQPLADTGLATSPTSCLRAICTASSTSSTSISLLCSRCFFTTCTTTMIMASSRAPPTPIPRPRYMDGLGPATAAASLRMQLKRCARVIRGCGAMAVNLGPVIRMRDVAFVLKSIVGPVQFAAAE